MSLTADDVNKIAYLARLGINSEDVAAYADDLSQLLGLVEQMQQVNTDEVIPMAHPMDKTQRLREDIVSETNQREAFQEQAPQIEAGLYLVPQVIE